MLFPRPRHPVAAGLVREGSSHGRNFGVCFFELGNDDLRSHGGLSSGPKAKEGRIRCADARAIHGREARQKRGDTSFKLGELYKLEVMARAAGVITGP